MPTIQYNAHTKRIIQTMYKMTDENDHLGAYAIGSYLIDEPELSDKFETIRNRSLEAGSLSLEDYNTRHALYKDMLVLAEAKLSASAYSKFYGAL